MQKFSFPLLWQALKDAFSGFVDNKVPKLAASLAYYTVFSLGPLMIVIIFLASQLFGQQAVEGSIYQQIEGFVGHESAVQLQETIKNAAVSDTGSFAAIIGIIALIIGATTMFAELQDSINMIWGLKPRPNVGIWKTIQNRLLSFGVIGSLVFLLLVSLAAAAIIQSLNDALKNVFPDITVVLMFIVNWIFTIGVTTILFMVVFRVLPDAKIGWKDIFPGALATTLLFLLGKFLISFYISNSDLASTYGAAGSFVILLVWIYYSSIILYFGAEFTKSYAIDKGARIKPNKYAQWEEVPYAFKKDKTSLGKRPQGTPDRTIRRPLVPAASPREAMLHSAASTPRPAPKKKKDSGPGMGTLLLGLAIFFMKNGGRKGEEGRR